MKFTEAIREAFITAMSQDEKVLVYGLGADDPRGIFGTTLGLQDQFGKERVFDMPTSENAMTGIAIGAGLRGYRTVLTHQRLDFALLSLDQIINNAAKWHFMFGGQESVPITIRMIMGRGWGQGPTHSQNLQALFAHIPGLKVVMPTTPKQAKGLMLSSIFDDDPVIFLEHRWLHNSSGDVPDGDYRFPLGKAELIQEGNDITVVSISYMTVETRRVLQKLQDSSISVEHIDLVSIRPIDWATIQDSVKKTGRLLVVDTGHRTGSVASEIVATVCSTQFHDLKTAPQIIAIPDVPTPTSSALTKYFYPTAKEIYNSICEMTQKSVPIDLEVSTPHDVPGSWFNGPF